MAVLLHLVKRCLDHLSLVHGALLLQHSFDIHTILQGVAEKQIEQHRLQVFKGKAAALTQQLLVHRAAHRPRVPHRVPERSHFPALGGRRLGEQTILLKCVQSRLDAPSNFGGRKHHQVCSCSLSRILGDLLQHQLLQRFEVGLRVLSVYPGDWLRCGHLDNLFHTCCKWGIDILRELLGLLVRLNLGRGVKQPQLFNYLHCLHCAFALRVLLGGSSTENDLQTVGPINGKLQLRLETSRWRGQRCVRHSRAVPVLLQPKVQVRLVVVRRWHNRHRWHGYSGADNCNTGCYSGCNRLEGLWSCWVRLVAQLRLRLLWRHKWPSIHLCSRKN
eukprot:RCo014449